MLNNVHEQYADLQAKVEELKKELAKKPDDEDFRIQSRHYEQHIEELQSKVDELEAALALLDKNNFQHAKPYMVCVPTEVWRKVFPALKQEGE